MDSFNSPFEHPHPTSSRSISGAVAGDGLSAVSICCSQVSEDRRREGCVWPGISGMGQRGDVLLNVCDTERFNKDPSVLSSSSSKHLQQFQ